jgi:hypothetical protein
VVSVDKLAEDPNNERKTVNNIEEMVASVKAHGIIEAITVVRLAMAATRSSADTAATARLADRRAIAALREDDG